jgi:Uma2 family endonuclease
VVVTCDPADSEPYYKSHPCLIVEVLSSATEVIDRREKRLAYQLLEDLREYLLVSQDGCRSKSIAATRRGTGGWTPIPLG